MTGLQQRMMLIILNALLIAVLVLGGCTQGARDAEVDVITVKAQREGTEPDYWPTVEWRTADPVRYGIDPDRLQEVLQRVQSHPIQSMVVVRDGYIVAEYYRDRGPDTADYDIYSVTKSIMSALIGIAIDQGHIGSVQDKVFDYFPEFLAEEQDEDKKGVTIAHLLAMTSGLDWPEWSEWNYYVAPMLESPDWPAFILQRPLASKPGEVFNYNTGGSQLLASILKIQTGLSAYDYAKQVLFEPLGIDRELRWYGSPDGTNIGGFGLQMTAREQAKFGLLYLHGGNWDGKQIVPADWVDESTSVHSSGHFLYGAYGYHWWVKQYGEVQTFQAMGYAGQYVIVAPKLNLVAVFSSNSPNDAAMPQSLFTALLSAVQE